MSKRRKFILFISIFAILWGLMTVILQTVETTLHTLPIEEFGRIVLLPPLEIIPYLGAPLALFGCILFHVFLPLENTDR